VHAPTDFLRLALYVDFDANIEQCFAGLLMMEEGIPLAKIIQDRDLSNSSLHPFCKEASR
jgi:hypothetical protein